MKVELDKHDFELIFQSICYFDHFEEFDEWFGKDWEEVNKSFHYLYSISREVGFNYDEPHLIDD